MMGRMPLPFADIPVSGHLVPYRPGRKVLASAQTLELTDRDLAILEAVAMHGLLSVELIELAFFPPAASRSGRSKESHERVRRLMLAGYLQRFDLPRPARFRGSRPPLYALSGKGGRLLRRVGRDRFVPRRPRDAQRIGVNAPDHDLRAARLWANLRTLVRSGRLAECRWWPERELRGRRIKVPDPTGRHKLSVLPDAYVELEYPDGRVHCWMLEIDMGTLKLERFRAKVRAFERYLAGGAFRRDFGRESFEVLVLTTGDKRREALRQAAREVVPERAWRWYAFATGEALDLGRIEEPLWRTLADTAMPLLYQ